MFKKVTKIALTTAILGTFATANDFNAQAEKDRLAFQKYFIEKFSDPLGKSASYFPYVPKKDIENNYRYPLSLQDFKDGPLAWSKSSREQIAEINDFPPYEIALDEGRELWDKPFANGKGYKDCFPDPGIKNQYPIFDTTRNEVITLEQAVNECRVNNGEKKLKEGKGDIAKILAYMAYESRGKAVDIKIPSAEAAEAYERGKKSFYKQRGYFYMSCAECHVQGAGQSVRIERLSPALGAVTHFPVYRIKWQDIGTLQRRLAGCVEDTGSLKPKMNSPLLKELAYFLSYMSNGIESYGPDTRK